MGIFLLAQKNKTKQIFSNNVYGKIYNDFYDVNRRLNSLSVWPLTLLLQYKIFNSITFDYTIIVLILINIFVFMLFSFPYYILFMSIILLSCYIFIKLT